MLPRSEQAKLRMFGRHDARLRAALDEHIGLERVPPWIGGTSTEPWPYGEGGDVPKGAAAAIADELAAAKKAATDAAPHVQRQALMQRASEQFSVAAPAADEIIAVLASPRSGAPAMAALDVQVMC